MQYDNRKISIRQLLAIVVIATFAPIIQVVPKLVGGVAGGAGWVSIILAFGFFVLFVLMWKLVFTKTSASDLYDLFCKIVGKFIAKILLIAYGIWSFVLSAFYARAFAERFLTTILPNTPTSFLLILLLGFAVILTYGKLESFARFAELSLYLFGLVFVFLLATATPAIDFTRMLPVTTMDAVPILRGSLIIIAIWGYLTFGLFLGDGIADWQNLKKQGIKNGIFLAISALIVFIITIGILGANWATRAELPFFTAVQTIRILNIVERLEALFLTFWVIADLVIVSLFLSVFINILRKLFALKKPKILTLPSAAGVYILAMIIANNLFELNRFSIDIALPVNLLLGTIIPILIFIIAILRKKC